MNSSDRKRNAEQSPSKVYCMKQLKDSSHSALDCRQLVVQLLTCHVIIAHEDYPYALQKFQSLKKKSMFHGQIYYSYAMQMEDTVTSKQCISKKKKNHLQIYLNRSVEDAFRSLFRLQKNQKIHLLA